MRLTVCSQIPKSQNSSLSQTLCGAKQENAEADAFKNFPCSQSGVIWKSQVMRADPLDVTLGIWRVSSLPRSCAPPRLGGVCASCALCVFFVFGLRAFVRCLFLRVYSCICAHTHVPLIMQQHACAQICNRTSAETHTQIPAHLVRFCLQLLVNARRIPSLHTRRPTGTQCTTIESFDARVALHFAPTRLSPPSYLYRIYLALL